jgi:hypothetical protein
VSSEREGSPGTPPGLELRPVGIPVSTGAADAGDFLAMARLYNEISHDVSGHGDHDLTPEELLEQFRPDPHETRLLWLVVQHGEPVGNLNLDLPMEAGSTTASVTVELRRHAWGRGLGSAAHALAERTARRHGRNLLQGWAEHRATDAAPPRIDAPTGFGSVPLDAPARFLLRHGYALEQVERYSALDLAADGDARLREFRDAAEAAASRYRVVQWLAPTPPEHVDDYAWMKSRMSTDAPSAGMQIDEEAWDAARVARRDAQHLDAGRTLQVTAAQHLASGRLVAFNELAIGPDAAGVTHQEDTLVLAEHRGHRLGMLVKTAGLLAWRARFPRSARVDTYNAEENRPMLDVNEAIGFTPRAYVGAWKKTLAAAAGSAGTGGSTGS